MDSTKPKPEANEANSIDERDGDTRSSAERVDPPPTGSGSATMVSVGLEMPVSDVRTDNWRAVLQQMHDKFRIRKAVYRQAAALYFKLDVLGHFLPLMLIQLAIAILSGLAQAASMSEETIRYINIANLIFAAIGSMWTGSQMKFAWAEKRVMCKTCAEKYDALLNEVEYRQMISKDEANHAAFYKWVWDNDRAIREETDVVPSWIMSKMTDKPVAKPDVKIEVYKPVPSEDKASDHEN